MSEDTLTTAEPGGLVSPGFVSVKVGPGLTVTRYGMVKEDDVTYDQWREAGLSWKSQEHANKMASSWFWGDWLNEGQRAYGEKYTDGMALTGLGGRRLEALSYVARKTPPHQREFDNLSIQHFLTIAPLRDDIIKMRLLRKANELKWSARGDLAEALEQLKDGKLENDDEVQVEPTTLEKDERPPVKQVDMLFDEESTLPKPATLEDELHLMSEKTYNLEHKANTWFARHLELSDRVNQSIGFLERVETQLDGKPEQVLVSQVLELLLGMVDDKSIETFSIAMQCYKDGNTTGLVEALDIMLKLMEGGDDGNQNAYPVHG